MDGKLPSKLIEVNNVLGSIIREQNLNEDDVSNFKKVKLSNIVGGIELDKILME